MTEIHVFGFGGKFSILTYIYVRMCSLTFYTLSEIKLSKAYVLRTFNLNFETKQVNCVFYFRLKKMLVTDH